MKKLNITKEAFEKSKYFKHKYGKLEYVSESGKVFKTNKGKILKFKESTKKFAKEASESEWLNTFKKAQDFVNKACEQLEVVAFEGGADVGNPIHKKLLRIWSEMRDVVVKTIPKESGAINESTKKFGKKFTKESSTDDIYGFYEWLKDSTQYDSGIHVHYYDNEDGSETVELRFDDRYQWDDEIEAGNMSKEDDAGVQDWIRLLEKKAFKNHWAFDTEEYDGEFIISVRNPNAEDDEEFTESTDDLEKEFTYKGVTITRYDYESLPSPMAASKLDDKTM